VTFLRPFSDFTLFSLRFFPCESKRQRLGHLFGFLVHDGVKRLLPAPALLQSPSWRKEAPFTPFANPSHSGPVKNTHSARPSWSSVARNIFVPISADRKRSFGSDISYPPMFFVRPWSPLRCMMYDPIYFFLQPHLPVPVFFLFLPPSSISLVIVDYTAGGCSAIANGDTPTAAGSSCHGSDGLCDVDAVTLSSA
jgi:hypothetical protein